MKTRTKIKIPGTLIPIDCHRPVVMLGSCFTDNIGSMLEKYLFNVSLNPFGVIYNPLSVVNALDALLHKSVYTEEDVLFRDELWFSFDYYTKFSDPSREEALEKINGSFKPAKELLKHAGSLIITFGTAFVYTYKETGRVVNNCHKIPASSFDRKMLTIDEILANVEPQIRELESFNPDLRILFTVSPVRHIKDGLVENQRSKATLLLAIRDLVGNYPEKCAYFPSYEIMTDDLRDYRYYGPDLLHPNEQAVSYIWELFRNHCIDREANQVINRLEPLIQSLQHTPLHRDTDKYRKFRSKLESDLGKLKNEFPFLHWENIGQII